MRCGCCYPRPASRAAVPDVEALRAEVAAEKKRADEMRERAAQLCDDEVRGFFAHMTNAEARRDEVAAAFFRGAIQCAEQRAAAIRKL